MIFYILESLEPILGRFARLALFEYITFRSGLALIAAFLVSLLLGPRVIRQLRALKVHGQIRKTKGKDAVDVYQTHSHKAETPIMGGVLIIASVALACLFLCDLSSPYVWLALSMMLAFGAIGFVDDFLKITRRNTRGLKSVVKLGLELALGACLAILVVQTLPPQTYAVGDRTLACPTCLTIPFVKDWYPNLGIFYLVFVMAVVTATSNAVNLTDGLDGLAIGITIITSLTLSVVVYLVTRVDYANYLFFPYIREGGDLVIITMALVGAGMGFLWYNSHPAEVFMGDTGSLAIGGLLGTVAVLIRQELLLVIIGGIFVVEAASVIIQVLSYRLRHKRVFLMAPIHHHFEKKGWPEAKIIARFWILAALLALAGLSTLKIR